MTLEIYQEELGWRHRDPIRRPTGTLDIPETWWDHFKLEHFPRWMQRRFPIQYRRVVTEESRETVKVCPHLGVPVGNGKHVRYLRESPYREEKPDREEGYDD